jgi:hypothetical protein
VTDLILDGPSPPIALLRPEGKRLRVTEVGKAHVRARRPLPCFRFSERVLGVTMLVKGREGRHALVCLGRGGACCGGDGRR